MHFRIIPARYQCTRCDYICPPDHPYSKACPACNNGEPVSYEQAVSYRDEAEREFYEQYGGLTIKQAADKINREQRRQWGEDG